MNVVGTVGVHAASAAIEDGISHTSSKTTFPSCFTVGPSFIYLKVDGVIRPRPGNLTMWAAFDTARIFGEILASVSSIYVSYKVFLERQAMPPSICSKVCF